MDGLRTRVSAELVDGLIRVTVGWVEVENGRPGAELFTETFAISPDRAGCSYFSRVVFDKGEVLPGTFWVDEAGNRHFVMAADPGLVGLIGVGV